VVRLSSSAYFCASLSIPYFNPKSGSIKLKFRAVILMQQQNFNPKSGSIKLAELIPPSDFVDYFNPKSGSIKFDWN